MATRVVRHDMITMLTEERHVCVSVIAQTWDGNDMDIYADDLAQLTQKLDLRGAIHVGRSTGGSAVTRYIGRHERKRVAKAVLIGAAPLVTLKTAANPGGLPIEVFDSIRVGVASNR